MVVDLDKCLGCHTCSVTCKAEWQVPAEKGRSWVKRLGPSKTSHGLSQTFYPGRCNHCDTPVCVTVCPVPPVPRTFFDETSGQTASVNIAATWKDPLDGVVLIDKERCIGCGSCVAACPYGARYMKIGPDKQKKADKCTFCIERLVQGLQPACVANCLTDALIFGDKNDPSSAVYEYIKKGAVRIRSSAVNIGPNVYYYGSKKDIELLTSMVTPSTMPRVSERRLFLETIATATRNNSIF